MQYIVAARVFQLDFAGSDSAELTRKLSCFLPLRRNELGFAGGFQLKNIIRQLLIDLNVGIPGQAIIATGFEELLLDWNSPARIDPENNPCDVIP